MASQLSSQDREQIDAGIKEKYNKVAMTPKGHFSYPTGRGGLKGLKYDEGLIAGLPNSVANSYCGVGNVFSMDDIEPTGVLNIKFPWIRNIKRNRT